MLHCLSTRHINLFLLGALFVVPISLSAQATTLTSINPEFTLLINDAVRADFGFGYIVERRSPGYTFGLNILRRHFSYKGKSLSWEYGAGIHRTTTRLDVTNIDGRSADISLRSMELSGSLRLFFDGFKAYKGLFRSQSGLFVGLRPAARLKGEGLLRTTYTGHGSVGVRTRGKRIYVQLSYEWPLWTGESQFTALGQGFTLPERNQRFTFLSLGYSLRK